jgi:hypothetical protein
MNHEDYMTEIESKSEIEKLFSNKKIPLMFEYYGTQDLMTGYELSNLIDNADFFTQLFTTKYSFTIISLDDFILYLLARKYVLMREAIPLIKLEEHKLTVSKIIDTADCALTRTDIGSVIKFIEENIQSLMDDKNDIHGLRENTLSVISKYKSGMSKQTFVALSKTYGYMLLYKYDEFEDIFEENPDLFAVLIEKKNLQEIESYRLSNILSIFAHILNKSNTSLKDIVNGEVDLLFNQINETSTDINDTNLFRLVIIYNEFNQFLIDIRDPRENQFSSLIDKCTLLLNQYLEKNGKVFSCQMPVDEMVNKWKDLQDWQSQLLSITHTYDNINKKLISRFAKYEKIPSKFIDLVTSLTPVDNYYTISCQRSLDIKIDTGGGLVYGICLHTELRQKYFSMLLTALAQISKDICMGHDDLEKYMQLIFTTCNIAFGNLESGSAVLNALCYSIDMLCCAMIENLFRFMFIDEVKDSIYVPFNKTTLGPLLSSREICDTYGEDYIKNISYFLTHVGEKKNIGGNYRNNFAHLLDIGEEQLTPIFASKMLFLLTDVINSTLIILES